MARREYPGVYPYPAAGARTLYRTLYTDSNGRQRQKRGFTSPSAAAKFRARMQVRAERHGVGQIDQAARQTRETDVTGIVTSARQPPPLSLGEDDPPRRKAKPKIRKGRSARSGGEPVAVTEAMAERYAPLTGPRGGGPCRTSPGHGDPPGAELRAAADQMAADQRGRQSGVGPGSPSSHASALTPALGRVARRRRYVVRHTR